MIVAVVIVAVIIAYYCSNINCCNILFTIANKQSDMEGSFYGNQKNGPNSFQRTVSRDPSIYEYVTGSLCGFFGPVQANDRFL